MADRGKQRRSRQSQTVGRSMQLGYYIIVTDTEETEKNYFEGLKRTIPAELQDKLTIVVHEKIKIRDLVSRALEEQRAGSCYAKPWIVFDRDQVTDFDNIIKDAQKKGIGVAWSNPCFEIWIGAYFGKILSVSDSVKCCEACSEIFDRNVGKKYEKNDKQLYKKLLDYGDEQNAIKIAANRHNEYEDDKKPSEMCPCTTVYTLVGEMKKAFNDEVVTSKK